MSADTRPVTPERLPRAAGGDARLRLLDLPREAAEATLVERLAEWGQPAYRARQVLAAAWARFRRDPSAMTELPATLRARLAEAVRIGLLERSDRRSASDGTVKYLWRLPDGLEVESVAIPSDGRLTFCVSSQAGCSLHCRFCATAYVGLGRNLTPGEICDQVLAMLADRGERPAAVNVVFMGMGEPGHNLDAVLAACRSLNDPRGQHVGARHLTVSTSGVVPAIRRLAGEPLQVRLAVSLHSAIQGKRASLMDVAARFTLPELLQACVAYHDASGRRITFEVAVIPGVNDGPEDARALAAFAGQVPSNVNLIPYNPVAEFGAPACTEAQANSFRRRLVAAYSGDVVVRRPRGRDIEAACGMLHRARAAADARSSGT